MCQNAVNKNKPYSSSMAKLQRWQANADHGVQQPLGFVVDRFRRPKESNEKGKGVCQSRTVRGRSQRFPARRPAETTTAPCTSGATYTEKFYSLVM
jgi:hypothetical protein